MKCYKKIILLSYICIASISATIITPALTQIQQSFNIDHHAIGWVVSIFLFGYVIGQLIYGPIAKRFGSLQSLRVGLIVNLIGIIICLVGSFTLSYHLLLVGRFISALGAASGLSCTFMLIHAYLDDDQTKMMLSFCIVSFTVGLGLAILIGGVVTQYINWQMLFIILLIHGAITYLSTFLFEKTKILQQAINIKAIVNGYVNALKNRSLVIFSLMLGSVSMFSYGYAYSAPIFAMTELHLSPSIYGYWNILSIFGMFTGGVLSSVLIKQLGARKLLNLSMLLVTMCLSALLILGLANSHNTLWFFILIMLSYTAFGLIFPCASYFATTTSEDKANASSMMSFLNMLSATLGVILMGYLSINPILAMISVLGIFFIIIALACIKELKLLRSLTHQN
ncbi:MFS transporter [Thiotrichales bacterium 19S3-7]|nr:MFS transporter [Thiotrichales bacterium 19S3-7]MCF6801066.1 MFS transporter [Thiotrichales bacterium 19S3-11]